MDLMVETAGINLSEYFEGTSFPVRPRRAEWPVPPDFLALVFFEKYRGDNTWGPVRGGSRIDIRKKAFLDDLREAKIGNGDLSVQFGERISRIVHVAMAQPIAVFYQEDQR